MELIEKASVVAEIERRIKELEPFKTEDNLRAHGAIAGYYQILSFLNTIDVKKDVDLKEDVDRILYENDWDYDEIDFYEFAKHFFELGLKAQKGE